MPVRFRVRAMEKNAMAAVMARRGCNNVWPRERRWNAEAMRLRKGRTLAEPNAAAGCVIGPEGGTSAGRQSRVLGCRRLWAWVSGLADAELPLVSARMRSSNAVGGSGRGDFNISIQAAPRRASASMALQLAQPIICRSKAAWSAAESAP